MENAEERRQVDDSKPITESVPDLKVRVEKSYAGDIKQYACVSNWASQVGHPCLRYLVLLRTKWQEKELHDTITQRIFSGGKFIEDLAEDKLKRAGLKIVARDWPFRWEKYELSGKIDFICTDPETGLKEFPVEVKGLSFDFPKFEAIEDFLYSDKHYIQCYPGQLYSYMIMKNTNFGLFMTMSKITYDEKFIWAALDYDYVEKLVKKCEDIKKHMTEGTLPECINDQRICQKCNMQLACRPDIIGKAEYIDDDELCGLLDRHEELKPVSKEYTDLHDLLKDKLKEKNLMVGNKFLVGGYSMHKKSYTVEENDVWVMQIKKLDAVKKRITQEG